MTGDCLVWVELVVGLVLFLRNIPVLSTGEWREEADSRRGVELTDDRPNSLAVRRGVELLLEGGSFLDTLSGEAAAVAAAAGRLAAAAAAGWSVLSRLLMALLMVVTHWRLICSSGATRVWWPLPSSSPPPNSATPLLLLLLLPQLPEVQNTRNAFLL